MKLSKNVLVGSLATTGMILGLVAPATTAFAAKTSGVVDPTTGAVTKSTTTDASGMEDAGTLGAKDSKLAIAFDDASGVEGNMGSAEASSTANVQVMSGILTLDAVPNFGFGNAAAGSTVKLQNNDKSTITTDGADGNEDGLLQVTESRSAAPGFTLTAQLQGFKDKDGNAAGGQSDDKYALNLSAMDLKNGTDDNVSVDPVNPLKTTGDAITTGAAGNVMDLAKSSYKTGVVSALFTNPDDASLYVPKDATDGSKAEVKSLSSVITWTLTAKPQDKVVTGGEGA
ncbi:WxL domain-containing protein [Companilactobacillus hulinensis]|uniref:WxL domain-containing protein n=1 Tax=Companilactobacillus hulinensis TaxID=2486007 RepID=UPI000F7A4821|nr:WxL domain-containing protein [Companilactobacillus hulinensis]